MILILDAAKESQIDYSSLSLSSYQLVVCTCTLTLLLITIGLPPSMFLSTYTLIYLYTEYIYISLCTSVCISVCISACIFVCISVCISIGLALGHVPQPRPRRSNPKQGRRSYPGTRYPVPHARHVILTSLEIRYRGGTGT